MWCCESIKWLFLICCIALPILWLFSRAFRFYVQLTVYYFCIFLTGQLSAFYVLPNYGDPLNWRSVHAIFRGLTFWFPVTYRIKGGEHLKSDKPFVVVCNHQSSLDLKAMSNCWPERCVPMMKSSMRYLGLMGITAKATASVFIERYNKESAINTVNELVEQIKKSQVKIWVFPEGTRNRNEGLLSFKKGPFHLAVQAKIPIVPVVFSSYKCFYERDSCKLSLPGFVIIEALPPVDTSNLTSEDVTTLSVEIREKMLKVLEKNSTEAARIFASHEF